MRAWVADASVLINLLGSGCHGEIVKANGLKLVVCEQALREVRLHPRDKDRSPVEDLLACGLERVSLVGAALESFRRLAESPNDLGDGEAATIAHAAAHGLGVLLDDGKARRVCAKSFAQLAVRSSVDLLRDALGMGQLSEDAVREALFDALRLSRMRVLPEHEDWVRSLLGPRAEECPSLPSRALRRQ